MIHTFIIAAISSDGFMAQKSDQVSTSWTSKGDKKRYVELTKRAGVVVMGSKTYETFNKPLKDRKNIIYSRDTSKVYEGCEVTNEDPKILLERLEREGFKEVAICGGSTIYTLFLEQNLVDTIYLTVEPIIFGQGVSIFSKSLQIPLKLVEHNKIDENTIQLEYKVIK
jgi:dihydrofolate reductase